MDDMNLDNDDALFNTVRAHWERRISERLTPGNMLTPESASALKFLWQHLSTEQKQELADRFEFHVTGSGTGTKYKHTYVFRPAQGASPRIQYKTYERGFCIHLTGLQSGIPYADHILAHKLMIETDERRWRAKANLMN